MPDPETVGQNRQYGPLGFGCSYLRGGFEMRGNVRIINEAIYQGLRHFDTAPLYGHGTSEIVLGQAIKSNRHNVSIATKIGISRPKFSWGNSVLRFLSTPIRKQMPSVARKVGVRYYRNSASKEVLSPSTLERSLNDSLRHMQTYYVDTLLLHDVCAQDLNDDVVEALLRLKSAGKTRSIGIGSNIDDVQDIDLKWRSVFDVYQHEWNVFLTPRSYGVNKFLITHRSINYALPQFIAHCRLNKARSEKYSSVTGVEVCNPDEAARLLLGASVAVNPSGMSLFASRRISRVADYAQSIITKDYVNKGMRLLKAMEPLMSE